MYLFFLIQTLCIFATVQNILCFYFHRFFLFLYIRFVFCFVIVALIVGLCFFFWIKGKDILFLFWVVLSTSVWIAHRIVHSSDALFLLVRFVCNIFFFFSIFFFPEKKKSRNKHKMNRNCSIIQSLFCRFLFLGVCVCLCLSWHCDCLKKNARA